MGFLIISEGGDGLGLALRLQAEGHKTSIWIRDDEAEPRGENLVQKGMAPDFLPVVIADCTGSGALLDTYRDSGVKTFAGSQLMDRLESDREYASQVFKDCGIQEPDSKEFHSWEDAEQFIISQDERLVFKPGGKLSGNLPSYVSYDSDDMLRMLAHFKGVMGESEPEFSLQEFIEGTCISSEVWCAQGQMLSPTNHTLERKQLLPGDLGPSGGCTGNVVWRCDDRECPLCESLGKLSGMLEENKWTGPVDINSVVSRDGEIYALEFTPRFGYDAFPTFLYGLYEGPFGDFIQDCVNGRGPSGDSLPLRNGFAAGVRVSVPPWPSEDFHSKSGLPLRGLRERDFERFYPYEVSKVGDELVTSGGWGIIGVCVGYSDSSVEEAFVEAYKLADRLRLPDKQYRNDLAEVFTSDLRKIRRALGVAV